jgi:hypothetical protein
VKHHQEDVADAVAKMLAMGTPGAPPVQEKPGVVGPEEAAETTAAPTPTASHEAPEASGQAPAGDPPNAASGGSAGHPPPMVVPQPSLSPQMVLAPARKGRTTISMDRDLVELLTLARSARGGEKTHTLLIKAVRQYGDAAHQLPDTPQVATVIDEDYGEVAFEAMRRLPIVAYLTPRGELALDRDARRNGLDRSAFCRRLLRAYLTQDKAFVPVSQATLLTASSPVLEQVLEEMQAQIDSRRPATVLPPAQSQQWAEVPLPVGTRLRRLTDSAQLAMPGCTSATQALLTVL